MSTIQLLIDDEGNREALRTLLEDCYEVDVAGRIRETDRPRNHRTIQIGPMGSTRPITCG